MCRMPGISRYLAFFNSNNLQGKGWWYSFNRWRILSISKSPTSPKWHGLTAKRGLVTFVSAVSTQTRNCFQGKRYWAVVWALMKLSLGSQNLEDTRDFLSPPFLSETSFTPSRKSLQSSQWVSHTSWSQNRKPQEGSRESLVTFTASLDNQGVNSAEPVSWITFRGSLWNNAIFPALSSVETKVLKSKFTCPGSQPARGLSIYMHAPVLTHDLTREESPNGGHKRGWPLGKFPASFDLFSRMLWVVWGQHCICNSVTFRAMSKFHLLVKPIIRRREINKARGDWRGWSVWPFQDCSCSPWRGCSGSRSPISSSMYTSENVKLVDHPSSQSHLYLMSVRNVMSMTQPDQQIPARFVSPDGSKPYH